MVTHTRLQILALTPPHTHYSIPTLRLHVCVDELLEGQEGTYFISNFEGRLSIAFGRNAEGGCSGMIYIRSAAGRNAEGELQWNDIHSVCSSCMLQRNELSEPKMHAPRFLCACHWLLLAMLNLVHIGSQFEGIGVDVPAWPLFSRACGALLTSHARRRSEWAAQPGARCRFICFGPALCAVLHQA